MAPAAPGAVIRSVGHSGGCSGRLRNPADPARQRYNPVDIAEEMFETATTTYGGARQAGDILGDLGDAAIVPMESGLNPRVRLSQEGAGKSNARRQL